MQPLDIPEGADISVSNSSFSSLYGLPVFPELPADLDDFSGFPDDDPEVKYWVFEEARPEKPEAASAAPSPAPDDAPLEFLDLVYHYVRGVTFVDTVSSPVPRYRVEKRKQDEAP